MSKLTIVPKQPSSAHFQHEKFIRNGTEACFFQFTCTSQEYTCITSLNKWIFSLKGDICWDICLHRILKSSLWFPRVQWQIFQIQQLFIHTQCSVIILACHWWYKLFVHWWMKGIYFASFYFRVWDLTRENKNPAKISTYTVSYIWRWC